MWQNSARSPTPDSDSVGRQALSDDIKALEQWLLTRALEHDTDRVGGLVLRNGGIDFAAPGLNSARYIGSLNTRFFKKRKRLGRSPTHLAVGN